MRVKISHVEGRVRVETNHIEGGVRGLYEKSTMGRPELYCSCPCHVCICEGIDIDFVRCVKTIQFSDDVSGVSVTSSS